MLQRRSVILSGISVLAVLPALRAANAAPSDVITRTEDEWRALLTEAQYASLRLRQTEQPYSSPLVDEKRRGVFACAGCQLALVSTQYKYNSRTGWPSFWQMRERAVRITQDRSQGLDRTAFECRRCGSHIGHVFGDGPPPTHLRYCANGASLTFIPA